MKESLQAITRCKRRSLQGDKANTVDSARVGSVFSSIASLFLNLITNNFLQTRPVVRIFCTQFGRYSGLSSSPHRSLKAFLQFMRLES